MHLLISIRRLLNRLLGRFHLRAGLLELRSGQPDRAMSHLLAALRLAGSRFEIHLGLARTCLRLNQFDRARREFRRAREIDPRRFLALTEPEDLAFEFSAQRRAIRLPLVRRVVLRTTEDRPEHAVAPRGGGDDFSSAAERSRFRALPPIRPADLLEVDIDALARQLGETSRRDR